MIVICEECGKKYRLDVSKIKGSAARFKCRVCTHMIVVSKPQPASPAPAAAKITTTETAEESTEKPAPAKEPDIALDRPASGQEQVRPVRKAGFFNLRTKMLLLFLFVPLVLMVGACLLFLWQLEQTSALHSQEMLAIIL